MILKKNSYPCSRHPRVKLLEETIGNPFRKRSTLLIFHIYDVSFLEGTYLPETLIDLVNHTNSAIVWGPHVVVPCPELDGRPADCGKYEWIGTGG